MIERIFRGIYPAGPKGKVRANYIRRFKVIVFAVVGSAVRD
jgi:hypothetical protein